MLRGGEKARDFKGTMAKLLRYLNPYKIQFLVVFIFAVASTVFNIVGPKILGRATTKLFEGAVAMIKEPVKALISFSSATSSRSSRYSMSLRRCLASSRAGS